MKVRSYIIAIIFNLLILAHLFAEEKYKVTLSLNLAEIDKKYYFVLEGTTNLPDEAILDANLYFLSLEKSKSDDEQVEVNEGFIDAKFVEVESGRFRAEFGGYKRKPFSINYRCVVALDPSQQPDLVRARNINRVLEKIDIRLGSRDDFEAELEKVRQELYDDFITLDKLFDELKTELLKRLDNPSVNKNSWKEWVTGFNKKLKVTRDKNETRSDDWIVLMERRGKIFVGGLCERLEKLSEECTKIIELNKDSKGAFTMMQAFKATYNEDMNMFGFDKPLEATKVKEIFSSIEGNITELQNAIKGGGYNKQIETIEGHITSNILLLADVVPQRALKSLTDISSNIQSVFAHYRNTPTGATLDEIAELKGRIAELKASLGLKD